MKLKGTNVVVTGGAGFIGSWIVEKLADDNNVTVYDRFSGGKMENIREGAKVVRGDIRDTKKVESTIKGSDTVFHMAANVQIQKSIKDPRMDSETNIGGTLNVLEACRKHDIRRVIFASSSAVYGNVESSSVKETMKTNPLSPYALSKLTAETYTKLYTSLYGLETVSMRYFNVYGLRQNSDSPYSGVLSIFTKKIKEMQELAIYGDGNQMRDFVNVRDVADANILAATSKNAIGKHINIGTGKSVSLNDIVKILEELTGKSLSVKYMPGREGEVRNSCADITLARKLLGYEPRVSIKEGLKELISV